MEIHDFMVGSEDECRRRWGSYMQPQRQSSGLTCDDCGCEICDGDDYWDVYDHILCEECIKECAHTCEVGPDPDEEVE